MLSQERNERLTAVGPGTPMGNLLRRYWWPVATYAMAGRVPVRRRLLGEPADSTFADRILATSYPVAELGGLIFAYLGPAPAPLLPRYDLFVWPDVWRDIAHAELALQLRADHGELRGSLPCGVAARAVRQLPQELAGEPPLPVVTKKHVKVAFEVFEHGILKRRLLEGQTEQDEDWKTGHPLVFPAMLRVGGGGIATFQIRVPVHDTHTWHVWYQTYRFDEPGEPVRRPAAGGRCPRAGVRRCHQRPGAA